MNQVPIFIVSTGRCGSTFLSDALNRHPEIISISEMFEPVLSMRYFDTGQKIEGATFFEWLAAPTLEERIAMWESGVIKELRFLPEDRSLASLFLCYTLSSLTDDPMALFRRIRDHFEGRPSNTPHRHLRDLFEFLKKDQNKQYWLERTGASLQYIEELTGAFPDARYVHIYRDGRDVALSMSRMKVFELFIRDRNEDRQADGSYSVAAYGRMWSDWEARGLAALAKIPPGNVLHISYGTLLEKPKPVLSKLLQFIKGSEGLSNPDGSWLDQISKQVRPSRGKWRDLGKEEMDELSMACEGMNARLGAIITA